MKLIKTIDGVINSITMYQCMLNGLTLLLGGSIVLSLLNVLPIETIGIVLSIVVLVPVCYIANKSLAIITEVPTNRDSWLITALILCCILPPDTGGRHVALLALAGLIAMASKFIVAYNRKHIFNPAAFAAVVLGLAKLLPATWWIGSASILPIAVIFGLVILRKIRRYQMFFMFLAASLLTAVFVGTMHDHTIGSILISAFKSSPLIFLGAVMLTEPESGPPRLGQQFIYAAIVGILFEAQYKLGTITAATPELALIAGNIFAYTVSPKRKLKLTLASRRQLAPNIYDFGFTPDRPLNFIPGQYLEWTMHDVAFDLRGNRRTFSLASAPGDPELHLAIKTADPGSAYKKALLALEPGDTMVAGQLAGNFILPKDPTQPLVFIAGGIGITPFVSMVRDMLHTKQTRDIVLFYITATAEEYCYQDLWKAAAKYGVKVIPMTSRLTPVVLEAEVPGYKDRRCYLSGPSGLVDAYRKLLVEQGIKRSAIVVDHFSGY